MPNMSIDALGSANRTPLLLACGARRYEGFDDEPAADGAEMQEVVRLLLGARVPIRTLPTSMSARRSCMQHLSAKPLCGCFSRLAPIGTT